MTPAAHLAEALARLIGRYADKPRLAAWIASYAARMQALDDAIVYLLETALDLDTSEGVHLDLLGRIVREARDGRTDDDYRRMLRARILVNRSQGRAEDLIRIVRALEGEALPEVWIQDVQPARVEARVSGVIDSTPHEIHARLTRAKAAGVALQTITHPQAPSDSRLFRLIRAADYPEGDTTTGLQHAAGAGTDGGHLAHVLA